VFIGANVICRYGRSTLGIVRRMGIGGVLVTLYSAAAITLFVPALQNTSVAHAMTIYAALPFVVAGIAWTWLGERPAARMLVANLVALLGLGVMRAVHTVGDCARATCSLWAPRWSAR
jgi:drug/metabolite transporter (DMT)-like permease